MSHWPDVPGLTTVGGRPRLPRSPEVVVRGLVIAVEGANEGLAYPAVVDRMVKATRVDRARAEGLLGWLPVSKVAAWLPDGTLALHPKSGANDLALRYVAWFATQPVPESAVEAVQAYVTKVTELSSDLSASVGTGAAVLPVLAPLPLPTLAAPATAPPLRGKLAALIAVFEASFLERGTHVRLSLLALLARQHVLLLGPPGTAKSLLARTLCDAFSDATYFEYLLSRFTHPDELFGPVSIPGLKEEDYRRLTEGFLPTASVAFLDEIFKANSAILNSLLTVVNERIFHHGRHRDAVPLLGVIGASNELPDPDGGLGALFDRFLVRMSVPPLAGPAAFLAVATGEMPAPTVPAELRISLEDIQELQRAAAAVLIPDDVRDALVALWQAGQRLEWAVSDRRWRQAVGFLRVAAASDGRAALVPLDLLLLEAVLAPTPEQNGEVRQAILEQLGTGAVPDHDLRAQWTLLALDRVAPLGIDDWIQEDGGPWGMRVDRRRRSLDRFLAHHDMATRALGHDRSAVDELAEAHLWVERVPSQVLATHISASRDLAHILASAEAYRDALASPGAVARELLLRLPEGSRRRYGDSSVVVLHVAGSRTPVSLAGERQPERAQRTDGLVQPDEEDRSVPDLEVSPERFLDWVDGRVTDKDLTEALPGWAARNAITALGSVRRLLGGSAVPAPPALRAP